MKFIIGGAIILIYFGYRFIKGLSKISDMPSQTIEKFNYDETENYYHSDSPVIPGKLRIAFKNDKRLLSAKDN